MASNALVGFTGFVGSHLKKLTNFQYLFNSKNFQIQNRLDLDLVIFSGARAEKWRANKYPDEDARHIDKLLESLSWITAKQFVLISTVDVFSRPNAVDENSDPPPAGLHPYGTNRLRLEQFVTERYPKHCIVRLPALFGSGLKKNAFFDLMNNHEIEKIDSRGLFQFYDLENLAHDLKKALKENLKLVHLNSQPVKVAEIAKEVFGIDFENAVVSQPARYDVWTRHAHLWGRTSKYQYHKDDIFYAMKEFVKHEKPK